MVTTKIVRFMVADEEDEEQVACVMVTCLDGSYQVWCGPAGPNARLDNVVTGLVGRFDGPLASTVCDSSNAQDSHGMAKRLAQRLCAVVHLSNSIPASRTSLLRTVEKQIVQQLTA